MKYGTASLWSFGLLILPGTALAAWGEMVWGLPVSVPSVPAVGLFVLALALLSASLLLLEDVIRERYYLFVNLFKCMLFYPLPILSNSMH